jgi:hypothetical protein
VHNRTFGPCLASGDGARDSVFAQRWAHHKIVESAHLSVVSQLVRCFRLWIMSGVTLISGRLSIVSQTVRQTAPRVLAVQMDSESFVVHGILVHEMRSRKLKKVSNQCLVHKKRNC